MPNRRFAALALLVLAAQLSAEPPSTEQVTIKGQTLTVYPRDKLQARGIDVSQIPNGQNAAYVYFDAINALVDVPPDLQPAFDQAVSGQWPSGEQGEMLANLLEQNRKALGLARQAAQMKDYHLPLFRGDSDIVLYTLLPTLQHQRQIARLMSAEAAQLAAQGQTADAMNNLLTIHRMGNQVAVGHTLIEGLVGLAVNGLAEQGVMQMAESGKVDAETLKSTIARMDELRAALPDWERMVRAEQQWAGSFIDDAFEIPGSFRLLTSGVGATGDLETITHGGWGRFAVRMRRLFLPDREMKRHMRDHYDALVNSTKSPDGTEGLVIDDQAIMDRIPAWDVAAKLMLPALSRSYEISLRSKSNFERARLAVAAAAYKAEQGERPATLGAMTPTYIREVPRDPMTGKLMQYPAVGATTRPTGMALITRENEEEIRKQRIMPVIASPRSTEWRQYVDAFARRHRFSERQVSSAESILKELESRAAAYESQNADKLKRLQESGDAAALQKEMAPVAKMFDELKNRLDALPTSDQRKAAQSGSN